MQVCSDGTTIFILHLGLIVSCMITLNTIPCICITSCDGLVGWLGGIHRNLNQVGRIAGATAINGLITYVASVIGERDVTIIQGLPHSIDLDFPATCALVDMPPIHLRHSQIERLSCTDARWSSNIADNRFIVHRNLDTCAIRLSTLILSKITNPIAIVAIGHIIVVESTICPILLSRYLPTLVCDSCSIVLNGWRGQAKASACTDCLWRSRCGNCRCVIHMDLNIIADIIATLVAHFIMYIPVVVGSWNILNAKGLESTIRALRNFPRSRSCSVVSWCGHIQIASGANGWRSLQCSRDIGRDIHCQLTRWVAIYITTTTLYHITNIPTIVCCGYII